MAGPFATVADLEEIWRTLDGAEKTKAERLLAAASRKIRLQCPSWAQADEAEPGICKDICCNMVKRAMVAEETFQSTLSMRRATGRFQSERAAGHISIHALHEESDKDACSRMSCCTDFNPRSP